MDLRTILNVWSSCLFTLGAGIVGEHHHTHWFMCCWEQNPGLGLWAWLTRKRHLPPNLITWVQSLGPTQWKEKISANKLSSEFHMYACVWISHTHTHICTLIPIINFFKVTNQGLCVLGRHSPNWATSQPKGGKNHFGGQQLCARFWEVLSWLRDHLCSHLVHSTSSRSP